MTNYNEALLLGQNEQMEHRVDDQERDTSGYGRYEPPIHVLVELKHGICDIVSTCTGKNYPSLDNSVLESQCETVEQRRLLLINVTGFDRLTEE